MVAEAPYDRGVAGDIDALLEAGNDALKAADWPNATASYRAALELGESGEALIGLGVARWWAGETQGALRCWERAYAAFSKLPDRGQAAFTAVYLCLAFRMSLGMAFDKLGRHLTALHDA